MPRKMPKLDSALAMTIGNILASVKRVELARLPKNGHGLKAMPPSEIEEAYERKFLKIFDAWEEFLEKAFLNYLCGRPSVKFGHATIKGGAKFYKSLADAETAMLTKIVKKKTKKDEYFLWASPKKVRAMVKKHIDCGRHEVLFKSEGIVLGHYSRIRHRIAHERQRDARAKFRDAVLKLSGLSVGFGYRPGQFLRKLNKSVTPNVRWIELIANRLIAFSALVI